MNNDGGSTQGHIDIQANDSGRCACDDTFDHRMRGHGGPDQLGPGAFQCRPPLHHLDYPNVKRAEGCEIHDVLCGGLMAESYIALP
jgi:hypothetical protein